MKVLGIGNAIVDVICKVDDDFLNKNGLTKSTMKLINEEEFIKLSSNLKIEKTIAGGSVANSIVGLAQLENELGPEYAQRVSQAIITPSLVNKNFLLNVLENVTEG